MAGEPVFIIEGLDELIQVTDYRFLYVTPTKKFMHACGAAMRQAAQRTAPKGHTKKLSRSHIEVYGPGEPPEWVSIRNVDQPVATFVAFGTRAHTITARNARALFWPGARHPVHSVNHPGTAPNPWMDRAQVEAQSEIEGELVPAWEAELEARFNRKAG